MTRYRSLTRCAIVVLVAASAYSCGVLARRPYSPLGTLYTAPLSLPEITREVAARTHPLDTLWAQMKVSVRNPAMRGKQYFLATVLFRNPDQLRLRGSRAMTSTLFEILVRGNDLQVYLNGERELFIGTLDEVRRNPKVLEGVDPNVFISLARAETLLAQALTSSTISQAGQTKHHYLFAVPGDTVKQIFAVRKSDLLIQELGVYDREDHLQLRVSYERYALVDGALMPVEMTITFYPSGATMRINVVEYKLNPPLTPQVFSTLGAQDAKRYPLSDLIKRQNL